MKTKNTVQLIGYLGKDPLIRDFKNGTRMAVLRLATHHRIAPIDQEAYYKSTWHTVTVWGNPLVEKVAANALKGSHIMIEGFLVYRSYQDKQGHTHYVAEINTTKFYNLDR